MNDSPERTIKTWLYLMEEDHKTARALFKSGRYTWCAFACQQFLEKFLKGAYVANFKKVPPYIHSLPRLIKTLNLNPPQSFIEIIEQVDKCYIAARYPTYKQALKLTKQRTQKLLNDSERVLQWLQDQLNIQAK